MPSTSTASTADDVGRVLHDLGLAGLLGGNLMGRQAFHRALGRAGIPEERGRAVNDAWRRYGTVNSLSLAAVTLGWLRARRGPLADRNLSAAERRLVEVKDALVATTAAIGVATAVEGVRFSRSAPEGAVPLQDGSHVASGTPAPAAQRKRALNALGRLGAVAEVATVVATALLDRRHVTRPARRRLLPGVGR